MASLVMLAIITGCAAFLYLKGTLVQGIAMVFNAMFAGFVAFAFFETLAAMLMKYSPALAAWAQTICFLLLFVLTFAILQTVALQIGKEKVDLGMWPERVGRVVCGIILGYVITGQLLVALAAAPLPSQYPYARFAERNPDPAKASASLLSPDGFVTGLFATISKGSFAPMGTPKSFGVLHADYLNQVYLNRTKGSQDVSIMTSSPALSVPSKGGVWEAPNTLRDAEGAAIPARGGEDLMLVRVGIKKSALKDAAKFTLSQLRLVCTPKSGAGDPLAGQGHAVYPIGYIGQGGRLEQKGLTEIITIQTADVPDNVKYIDFAFYVPTQLKPTLIEFKRNNVEKVSAVASEEDVPEAIPFVSSPPASGDNSNSEGEGRRNRPNRSSRDDAPQGTGLSPAGEFLTGGALQEN
jgi:hypothetical protein